MGKHYRPPGKKKEGNAAKFVTRSQALKLLQISLPLFRKLCILKGVTPRQPKKKFRGNHQTYYHVKDIAFLHHEPLLEIHRAIRTHERKIKKAEAKKNIERANRLREQTPKPKIDRIIRQRYPRFVDALGELDDCLSMVHLFAALPASESKKIDVERVHKCRRLAHEWQAFISRTHKLRKTFVSVKGIYYQAEVEGQTITWLTPHSLQQVVSDDVDIPTMLNFLQLYEPLLGFVNFRLYHSINLKYPPILDPRLEALAADLYALSRYVSGNTRPSVVNSEAAHLAGSEQLEAKQSGAESEDEKSELRLSQLQHQLPSNEPGALMHLVEEAAGEDEEDQDTRECRKLFENMRFFLSREVPRESLLFIIPAFGGIVSWEGEGAPFGESDQSITHQIVDREAQGHMFLSREYVQPQWIFDCVNARIILPTKDYAVGRIPPPHLSPFVDNEEEGAYVPDYAKTIIHLQAAARKEVLPLPGVGKDLEDPQNLLVEGVIDRAEANEAAQRKQKMMVLEQQYHDDLKKELQGVTYASTDANVDKQTSTGVIQTGEESITNLQVQQSVDDVDDMGKLMMSRKKRKLLEAMQSAAENDFLRETKQIKRSRKPFKRFKKMVDQNQEPIVAQSSEEQQQQHLQHSVDPTTYLLYHAAPSCTTTHLCYCFGSNNNNNSIKRRSPSSSATATLQDPSSFGAATTEHNRASKKLFREQQDLTTLNGLSTISFPLSHGTFPAKPLCPAATAGGFPATPFQSPVARASGLSPLPRGSLNGFVRDPTSSSPATARTFSRSSSWGDKGVILTKEEASSSMRLRRMKDCLREMRKWWDDVMREEEEEDEPEGAECDKVLSKDDCGGDAEEAVSVEWAEKCLSICFKCPCSKGYQILLSGNNCYYKLCLI